MKHLVQKSVEPFCVTRQFQFKKATQDVDEEMHGRPILTIPPDPTLPVSQSNINLRQTRWVWWNGLVF